MNRRIHDRMLKKEKGVVLLTSLIFLLVLLAMLRFSLNSARVEEQKAAIDLDMVSARESAQSALDFAEQYILQQGELYCAQTLNRPVIECAKNPADFAGELFALPDADLINITNTGTEIGGTPAINAIVGQGLYTGTFIQTLPNCRPFWACINWPVNANAVRNSATQMGLAVNNALTAIECTNCILDTDINTNPRFIIERFTSEELAVFAPQFAADSPNTIILRITAVGFGKGAAGTVRGGNVNLSNVLLQSTYVFGG